MSKEFKITGKHVLIAAGIGVGLAIAHEYYGFPDNLIGAVKEKIKKSRQPKLMTVKEKRWTKYIKIARYEEVTETGWEVPNSAYDVRTERRARESDKIEIGEVSIPLERTDIYYIYKIKKWVYAETFTRKFTGQYSIAKSVEFEEEIQKRLNASNKSSDVKLNPEIGDCKIMDTSIDFDIIGCDYESCGYLDADVDMFFYIDTSIGETLEYSKVTYGGTVKGLRRHDETATN